MDISKKYEVILLNKQEMKILFYSSPFFKEHQQFRYLSNDEFNRIDYDEIKNETSFSTTFVCIFEKKSNPLEIEKGREELKKYPNAFVGKQEIEYFGENLDKNRIKSLIDRKIVGVAKYAYPYKGEYITRVFASLNPEYIGKGLSHLFDDWDYKLCKEYLEKCTREYPYIKTDDDFSTNALFGTKEKILMNRKKLMNEFPAYKDTLEKYYMYPKNIDDELESHKNLLNYFKDLPFFGKESLFEIMKTLGLKSLKHENDSLIEQSSDNQWENIYNTIVSIKGKTDKRKFTFAFSLSSNQPFKVEYKQNYSSLTDKKQMYGIYFVEYDEDIGITIINDTFRVKKNHNSKSKILEEKLKFEESNEWYTFNKTSFINEFDLLFNQLKSSYLGHHHSKNETCRLSRNVLTLDDIKEKAVAWKETQKELKKEWLEKQSSKNKHISH